MESGDELSGDLVNKVVMSHALPIFHDPNNASLRTGPSDPS